MPFQAWICTCGVGRMRTYRQLQWGHALSGMDIGEWQETGSSEETGFNGAMPFQAWISGYSFKLLKSDNRLQWGHALSGMDTFAKGVSGSSMDSTLQWGHALSGMDTRGRPMHHNAHHRFNGAMPFQAWIRKRRDLPASGRTIASMGPCPFRHGYLASVLQLSAARLGFNGAMPFQAWIRG